MTTRRDFLKKTAYSAPAILTLSASPAFAGHGSRRPGKKERIMRRRKDRRKRWKKRYGRG